MPELEGVALVAACAEMVMGWLVFYASKKFTLPGPGNTYLLIEDRKGRRQEVRVVRNEDYSPDWSPLRSMSDAWQISDRMHTLGYDLQLGNFRPGEAPDTHNWHAKFANGKCTASFGYGMTAGEAILRAALAAIEEGEKL